MASNAAPRSVPLHLYLECQSTAPSERSCSQQTELSEWRNEKPPPAFVPPRYLPPINAVCEASTSTGTDGGGNDTDREEASAASPFDWDTSVQTMLDTLVDKSAMQAAVEVRQEEQWSITQHTAAEYDERLAAEKARVAQLEEQESSRLLRQQADLQAARQQQQREKRLISERVATAQQSIVMATQLQRGVEEKLQNDHQHLERASVQRLLQDAIVTTSASRLARKSQALAAVDQCVLSK